MGIEIFKKHLREKRAIKISSGSENYNLESVAKICRASQSAKASAVEIAINKDVYNIARKNTKLPLFASSIHPFQILNAVKMGVDGIVIGDYFEVYKKGQKYSPSEIYDIILETLGLINGYDVYTCVTIPASISSDEQKELIKKLEILGVDLVQTEGYKKSPTNPNIILECAEFSIKTLDELSKYTKIPIMATSAINNASLIKAFDMGANAVNVDFDIHKSDSEAAIKTLMMKMTGSISYKNSLNREIVRSERELSLIGKF